jgi:hypothetical protein
MNIRGDAGLHTVGLWCNNLTTGKQYSGAFVSKEYGVEFSFNSVALQEGDNFIEVTGTDDCGVTCREMRLITYNPVTTFFTPLQANPIGLWEGENADVTFSFQAKMEGENTFPEKFDLYESTISGDLLEKIAELKPDATVGAGGYSVTLPHPISGIGRKYYRAVLEKGGRLEKSIPIPFSISFNKNTEEQQQREIMKSVVREVLKEGTEPGAIEVRLTRGGLESKIGKIAELLNEREDVKYVKIISEGLRIRVRFTSGFETGWGVTLAPPSYDPPDNTTSDDAISDLPAVPLLLSLLSRP